MVNEGDKKEGRNVRKGGVEERRRSMISFAITGSDICFNLTIERRRHTAQQCLLLHSEGRPGRKKRILAWVVTHFCQSIDFCICVSLPVLNDFAIST